MRLHYTLDEGLSVPCQTGVGLDTVASLQNAVKCLVKSKEVMACEKGDLEVFPLGINRNNFETGTPLGPDEKLPRGSTRDNPIFVHAPHDVQELDPAERYLQQGQGRRLSMAVVPQDPAPPRQERRASMPTVVSSKLSDLPDEFKKKCFVKYGKQTLVVLMDPDEAWIHLKLQLAETTDVPTYEQRFYYNGIKKPFEDDKSLRYYGLQAGGFFILEREYAPDVSNPRQPIFVAQGTPHELNRQKERRDSVINKEAELSKVKAVAAEAAKLAAEEEDARKKAAEEAARLKKENDEKLAREAAEKLEQDRLVKAAELKAEAAEEAARLAAEEEAKKQEELEWMARVVEAKRKADEERLAREAENKRRVEEERIATKAAEKLEAERLAKELELEAARKKAVYEAARLNKVEEDRLAREAAEEADRLAAEEEAKKKAEEEWMARVRAAKKKADEDRLAREAESKRKEEEDRIAKEAAEKVEQERLRKEEADRLAREVLEEVARLEAEDEQKRKDEEDWIARIVEEQRKAKEAEEEAKRAAQFAFDEEARRKAEAERQAKEAEALWARNKALEEVVDPSPNGVYDGMGLARRPGKYEAPDDGSDIGKSAKGKKQRKKEEDVDAKGWELTGIKYEFTPTPMDMSTQKCWYQLEGDFVPYYIRINGWEKGDKLKEHILATRRTGRNAVLLKDIEDLADLKLVPPGADVASGKVIGPDDVLPRGTTMDEPILVIVKEANGAGRNLAPIGRD